MWMKERIYEVVSGKRECTVGDRCKFEFDAIFDGQPVKLTKEVCRGAM
jgi:hypothetical protein